MNRLKSLNFKIKKAAPFLETAFFYILRSDYSETTSNGISTETSL